MPELPIGHTTLSNGLEVVSVFLPHLHTSTIALYAKVGPRFESESESGLSHFLEHMMFRGSHGYPSSYELNFAIEALGATLLGETGRDWSSFQVTSGPDAVLPLLDIIGQLFTRPRFSDLELERRLILEEINEEESDDPGDALSTARELFLGSHPIGRPIIGSRASIEGFTEDDVRRHFGKFYGARNLVLCVAGPVESQRVLERAGSAFADLPPGHSAESPPLPLVSGALDTGRFSYEKHPGGQSTLALLWPAPGETSADYAAAQALLRCVDDGMSTPLHYRLCDQLGLAYSLDAYLEPLFDLSLFCITGSTAHGKVANLVAEIIAVTERARREPFSPREVDKVKQRARAELLAACDDAPFLCDWYGGQRLYYRPPSIERRMDEIASVSAEQIRRVACAIFDPNKIHCAVHGSLSPARRAEVKSSAFATGAIDN